MRTLRILLLVLLTAMLPVRGAMAAAMVCPPHAGAEGEAHHLAMAAGAAQAEGAHAAHDHDHGSADDADHDAASGLGTCNLCSACCSVPPVPSAAPVLPLPHDTAAAVFPPFAAPAPTFQSEGPERPPRSI